MLYVFTTRRRKDREAARPKLVYIYKKPPKPETFDHWDHAPSCSLCQLKFLEKEEWATHKESELHKSRERWAAMEEWWIKEGMAAKRKQEDQEWNWYKHHILIPQAKQMARDANKETYQDILNTLISTKRRAHHSIFTTLLWLDRLSRYHRALI